MTGVRAALALLLAAAPASAEMIFPPGFTAQVYVSGQGFGPEGSREVRGIPSSSTLAVDGAGLLYVAEGR